MIGCTVSTIGEEKRWNPRFVGRDRQNFHLVDEQSQST